MENFVQFFTNVAPFISIFFILVLIIMLFFEQRKSEKLKQEKDMSFFLINQLSDEMKKDYKQTIHIEIDPKGFSTIRLAEHDGVRPSKEILSIRAVFTRHLGIKLTP